MLPLYRPDGQGVVMAPDPARSRNLSIYLLKAGYDASNALIDDHRLGDPVTDATIPAGSTLYVIDDKPRQPWWKLYFGISRELNQSNKAALLLLKSKDRTFALCFGHIAHNLRDESYEYDFGLRITLNCVDPLKLKNTDTIEPGAARRQRTQVAVDSDLTYFDFEGDSTVLRSLTGAVKPQYSELLRNVTGSSNLRITTKTRVEELTTLCATLLTLYQLEDFKTSFPEVQNVTPVRDPQLIKSLNDRLVAAVQDGNTEDVLLAIPELLERNDSYLIGFTGAGASTYHYETHLQLYYDYLTEHDQKLTDLSIDTMKRHRIAIFGDDFVQRQSFTIYRALIFDTKLSEDNATYHLMDGNWFRFDDDYIARTTQFLEPFIEPADLPACEKHLEADYNEDAAKKVANAVCLDKGNISPGGQTQIEPCDVLFANDENAVFAHVKFSTASSQLSHLFNQGSNAMTLLRSVDTVPTILDKLIAERSGNKDTKARLKTLINEGKVATQYVVVTHKNPEGGVANLPLFSRMSLARAVRTHRAMHVPVSLTFVRNIAPDRQGQKKPRKKPTKKSP